MPKDVKDEAGCKALVIENDEKCGDQQNGKSGAKNANRPRSMEMMGLNLSLMPDMLLLSDINVFYIGLTGFAFVNFKAVDAFDQRKQLGEAVVARVKVGLFLHH